MKYNLLNVFTDGGARGNPGESAVGVYIVDEKGNQVAALGKKIGIATNNVAEYMGVLEALSFIIENKKSLEEIERINFFLDSNLVCSQIRGFFKVKDAKLRDLLFKVNQKKQKINLPIYYSHIPREKNKKADFLVNQALDGVF